MIASLLNPLHVGKKSTLPIDIMTFLHVYEYHLGIRLDGKYYCRIYQHEIPGTIATTEDFDTEDDAVEASKGIILVKGFASRSRG
jgi:hypothetical protein